MKTLKQLLYNTPEYKRIRTLQMARITRFNKELVEEIKAAGFELTDQHETSMFATKNKMTFRFRPRLELGFVSVDVLQNSKDTYPEQGSRRWTSDKNLEQFFKVNESIFKTVAFS